MADKEKINYLSQAEAELLNIDGEEWDIYKENYFITLDLTKRFFQDLNFSEKFIDEYSQLFHRKKIYLKSQWSPNFFIMSYFSKDKSHIFSAADESIKFLSSEELLDLLRNQSKFFQKFPLILLKTSILISGIEENSPIKISDIHKIKKNLINLNNDPNIIFDDWQKNFGIINEEDLNISRILEYRDELNLERIEIKKLEENNKLINSKSFNLDRENGVYTFSGIRRQESEMLYSTDRQPPISPDSNKLGKAESSNKYGDSYFSLDNNAANTGQKCHIKSTIYNHKIELSIKENNLEDYTDHESIDKYIYEKARQEQLKTYAADKADESKKHFKHLISGAFAGIFSRIITAPLERLKILYQVNYAGKGLQPPNVFSGLREVYRNEGFVGLFRGNFVNLIKCTPDNAIKFYIFEKTKFYFSKKEKENKFKYLTHNPVLKLFICGGISGTCATVCIFPLDVLKTRISASDKATYNGILDTGIKLYQEGGFRIFYRGIQASLSSAIPNCGLNLSAYETLKKVFSGSNSIDNAKLLTTPTLMLIGGLSAMFSSTILYPLQTLQSRIIMGTEFNKKPYQNRFINDTGNKETTSGNTSIVSNLKSKNVNANNNVNQINKKPGLIKLAKMTIKQEGFKGFYKGYCPGISKIILGNALSFSLYENLKNIMDIML